MHRDNPIYFDNLESAIAGIFSEGPSLYTRDEIVRFESEQYLLVFFPGDIEGPFFRQLTPSIFSFLFEIRKDDGMLSLLYQWPQGIEAPLLSDVRGFWEDEDRIARDIVYANARKQAK